MPVLDSCINATFEPGNIGSNPGTTPTVITPGTLEDPVTYDPEAVTYSLDYSKFYDSMYLLLLMFGGGGLDDTFLDTDSTIPMTYSDVRFASNTTGTSYGTGGQPAGGSTVSNKDWSDNPTYTDGGQVWTWSTGDITLEQCRIDWREGPRLAASSGDTLTINECYINCVGFDDDHADAFQGYIQTGGLIVITNSHIRAYTPEEAIATYGGTATGSTCWFWSDGSEGTIRLQNVILHGGDRMFTVNCDSGVTHIDFDHVYFIPEPGYPETWFASIENFGGSFVIDQWNEVREASIVAGVLVPGAVIPSP